MLAAALAAFLPAIEKGGQHDFQPGGVKEFALDMIDDHAVELIHRDRAALAARLALPSLD
jgi:hypothetical protein